MYRLTTNFRRFSTFSQQKETLLEHLNTNGKRYSIMAGLIAAGLGGLNYVVGLQMKPLQLELYGIKEELRNFRTQMKKKPSDFRTQMKEEFRELRTQMKEEFRELRIQMKDSEQRQEKNMKELKSLLTPLVVQVQANTERYEDLNRRISF